MNPEMDTNIYRAPVYSGAYIYIDVYLKALYIGALYMGTLYMAIYRATTVDDII